MKGIELAEKYFYAYGLPMIEENFPDLMPKLAFGIAGAGSECYGFDDEISRDHDFEPGFCIFVPGENIIDSKTIFRLSRAYAKLPMDFEGIKRLQISPVGGARHGVIKTSDFYRNLVNSETGDLSVADWFSVPENFLAEATNGKIFRDDFGEFSLIRQKLSYYPEDVRLKKLAGNLLLAKKSGQYNYERCLAHGETAAAQLAAISFVQNIMSVIFLLSKKYMPYYKWSFRALKNLPLLSSVSDSLEYLLTSDNSQSVATKKEVISVLCSLISQELKNQNLSEENTTDLEKHAFSVNNQIKNNDIRNSHILSGV